MATATRTRRPAEAPGDRLAPYRAKRHFDRTPEPSGSAAPTDVGQRFVIQRHRARRLHYDLRLEADGVLISWAVPKGPTRDPKARRMAVHVEDHPLDYFDFEGVIPEGEYGGGDVIVWDWGTWSAVDPAFDLRAAVDAGDVHVDLHGEKLAGRFVLVRRDDEPGAKEQWLLLHKNDDDAVAGWDPEAHDRSVKSGRTNDEVKADPDFTWDSAAPADVAAAPVGPGAWPAPTEDELEHLGVRGMPKVTGRRGIQIWIPVGPGLTFDDTRAWVEKLSRMIGHTVPELVSWEWRKDRRGGLARLDYTQNAINKTLVVPFGARPSPGAPVSVPIEWDELDDPDLRPDRWTIRTVLDRLDQVGDPLRPLIGLDQRLPKL